MITAREQAFSLQSADLADLDENQIIEFPLNLASISISEASSNPKQPLATGHRKTTPGPFSLDSVKSVLPLTLQSLLDSLILNPSEEEGKEEEDRKTNGLSVFEWHPFKTVAAFIHSQSVLYIHSFTSNGTAIACVCISLYI